VLGIAVLQLLWWRFLYFWSGVRFSSSPNQGPLFEANVLCVTTETRLQAAEHSRERVNQLTHVTDLAGAFTCL
jgi:hypothetical protein